jgi:hypothetical protein
MNNRKVMAHVLHSLFSRIFEYSCPPGFQPKSSYFQGLKMPIRNQKAISRVARIFSFLLICSLSSFSGPLAYAEEADVIVTDRPDFVESSAVVGKGRFQIEAAFASERHDVNGRTERLSTTPLLLRAGIGDDLELRLETDGRSAFKSEVAGITSTTRGYADISVGVKWHVQDGEGMRPAIAWLVHADLNTGSHAFRGNGVRPSLRMVAEWELPHEFSLGVMPGLLYDKSDDGRRFVSGVFGAVVGKSWTDRFRTFFEIAWPRIATAKNGGSSAIYDIGIAYLLSNRWQIDTAFSRAANRNAPDLAWTVGLSRKF